MPLQHFSIIWKLQPQYDWSPGLLAKPSRLIHIYPRPHWRFNVPSLNVVRHFTGPTYMIYYCHNGSNGVRTHNSARVEPPLAPPNRPVDPVDGRSDAPDFTVRPIASGLDLACLVLHAAQLPNYAHIDLTAATNN